MKGKPVISEEDDMFEKKMRIICLEPREPQEIKLPRWTLEGMVRNEDFFQGKKQNDCKRGSDTCNVDFSKISLQSFGDSQLWVGKPITPLAVASIDNSLTGGRKGQEKCRSTLGNFFSSWHECVVGNGARN